MRRLFLIGDFYDGGTNPHIQGQGREHSLFILYWEFGIEPFMPASLQMVAFWLPALSRWVGYRTIVERNCLLRGRV
jgi:hypothetical protein